MLEPTDDMVGHHEKLQVPLYKINYHVFLSVDGIQSCAEHVERVFPIQLELPENSVSFMCVLKYDIAKLDDFAILIDLGLESEDILSLVAHQSVRLSWEIMHRVGVHPNVEANTTQAHLVEAIFKQISEVINDFKSGVNNSGGGIDEL